MLTVLGSKQRLCDGLPRRSFLRIGAWGGLLSLPDCLRLQAQSKGVGRASPKSVIMVCLNGGPSHIDMYDLKPDAPAELRGEFRPIATKVPGFDICELMPRQAEIADKLALVRSMQWPLDDGHHLHLCFTGFPKAAERPSFGSIVSRLRQDQDPENPLPMYVSMAQFPTHPVLTGHEEPSYVGKAYRPFVPYEAAALTGGRIVYTGPGVGAVRNLEPHHGLTLGRFQERNSLRRSFDQLRREVDARGDLAGVDAFTRQALDMVTSNKVRDAFDLSREPAAIQEKYGGDVEYKYDPDKRRCWEGSKFLLARRLVEAGIPVVTLAVGVWDSHVTHFTYQRDNLPLLDRSIHALVTDLHDRGLDRDVAVVVWGEMGRTPRINSGAGRDHWPSAGFALFAGGGLRMGQVIGASDVRGERPRTRIYRPQNVLATLYHVLGISPSLTFPDHAGRPRPLLDDQSPIAELV